MSWPTVALGDICELKYGKSLPSRVRDGGAFRVFGSNGIVGSHSATITNGPTIIVGRKGSIGELNYSNEACWPIDTTYFVDRTCTKADIKWLLHVMAALRLTELNKSAAIPGLNRNDAYEKRLMLPPLPEQRRIAAILDKADALRTKRREAIAKLDQLLKAVFLKMFGDPVTNPKGWPMLPFGTVTDSRLGKMLDKRTSQGEHMKPYLANLNVQWGRFELNTLRSMHFSLKDQQEFSLRSGDLLMCEGGQPGRCAIWQEQLTDCYYQKALHRIRCHQEKCVPEYIQWLFWFLSQANAFSSAVTTATIAHLPGIKLKKMLIPLPPIEEQRSFASLIQSIEKNAALHRLAEEKLDHMFSSLQKSVFEGSQSA